MTEYKIKKTSSGNCSCRNCGKDQPGCKLQPWTVWWKEDTEKRGHQEPVCSEECAREYIDRRKQG